MRNAKPEAEERSQLLPMKMLIPLLFLSFLLFNVLFAPFVVSGYLILKLCQFALENVRSDEIHID